MKNTKELKNKGKLTVKGPKVKTRKKSAPATKAETPKKGKGSYKRKETFDESTNISEFIEAILLKNYSKANQHLKQAVEAKLEEKIQSELNTPLF